MNRQKTIGRSPSSRSRRTTGTMPWSFASPAPSSAAASRAKARRRRRSGVSPSTSASAPGTTSDASAASSSPVTSRTTRRPSSSISSGVSALGGRCAGQQRGGRRARARAERAQEAERRPPADALAARVGARLVHRLAREVEHAVEQRPLVWREAVGLVLGLAIGERRVVLHEVADVRPPPLDEVAGQPPPVGLAVRAGEIVGQIGEVRLEERQQRAERVRLAAVRRRGDEDQMAVRVARELGQQRVALLTRAAAARARPGEAVRLVDDDELRAGADELGAAAVGLDVLGRDDDERVGVEQRLADAEPALQAARGRGEDDLGVDVELLAQLALPLLGQVRRAEHGEPGDRRPGRAARARSAPPRRSCRCRRRRRSAAARDRAAAP